jgi:hypothetical protein
MNTTTMALGAAMFVLLVAGCGGEKKVEPVAVGDMEEYRDPGFGFRIKFPKGWSSNTEVGHARFFNAQDVDKKFLDPTGPYPNGVSIGVVVTTTSTPGEERKRIVDDMAKNGFQLGTEQAFTVSEKPALRIPYTARYSTSVVMAGEHVYIEVDTLLYDLELAGFGDMAAAYKNVFDASLKSFTLPAAVAKDRDETLPSESYTTGATKYFTYEYPENFNFSNPPKGTFESATELRGYRQDCSIRFDIFDAKKLPVEKVFDQNKGKYKARGTGKATIGGDPALYVAYSPTPQVDSRAYFTVHNDKVLRVTMNWFKPQEKEYLLAFERIIGSITYK